MDNIATTKSNSLKWGLAIKILLVIALTGILFSVAVYLSYLMNTTKGFSFSEYYLPRYVSVLLMVATFVLFVLYIFILHQKQKCAFFVPLIFILFAIRLVLDSRIFFFAPFAFEFILYDPFWGGIRIILPAMLAILLCILAVISMLADFKKKNFFIAIASLACIAYQATIFITAIKEVVPFNLLLIFSAAAGFFISWCCLYIGLILFTFKNNILPVFSSAHKNAKAKKLAPEQALIALNADRDHGVITEEEYLAQRAEIINNL